jgi:hypothetical protein
MLLLLVLLGCGAPEPPPYPNILLVTLDTTRADRLGVYGYHRDTSPHIDALAERAVVFDHFVVPMATTLRTHVSVLTGTHPLEHGVLANIRHGGARFVTSPGLRTFAEFLGELGYQTAAFVSATPLKRGTGIEHGFEHFSEPRGAARTADVTTGEVVRHLKRRSRRAPHFTWVHFYDPHSPFEPPEPHAARFRADEAQRAWVAERAMAPAHRPHGKALDPLIDGDLYDGEIAFMEEQIGALLGSVWMEQLHAPWLIVAPGQKPRRVARTVTAGRAADAAGVDRAAGRAGLPAPDERGRRLVGCAGAASVQLRLGASGEARRRPDAVRRGLPLAVARGGRGPAAVRPA